jgi:hypothetical protein
MAENRRERILAAGINHQFTQLPWMNHPITIKMQEGSLGEAHTNAGRMDPINQTRSAL